MYDIISIENQGGVKMEMIQDYMLDEPDDYYWEEKENSRWEWDADEADMLYDEIED